MENRLDALTDDVKAARLQQAETRQIVGKLKELLGMVSPTEISASTAYAGNKPPPKSIVRAIDESEGAVTRAEKRQRWT